MLLLVSFFFSFFFWVQVKFSNRHLGVDRCPKQIYQVKAELSDVLAFPSGHSDAKS